MSKVALLLTALSGLSTGLGGVAVALSGAPTVGKLGHLLSFSAGVMVYLSFMDLLLTAVASLGFFVANVAFFAGAIAFLALVTLVPEPDVSRLTRQRGKTKKDDDADAETTSTATAEAQRLLTVGLVTAFGISLHNLPEGIAVYLSCVARGPAVGLPLTLAIAAHNIPEGMAVAAPVFTATRSRARAVLYSTLSGAFEPLGALAVALVLGPWMTERVVQALLAGVAGVMVAMSFRELLPTTLQYVRAESAALSFVGGMLAIFLTVHALHATLGV